MYKPLIEWLEGNPKVDDNMKKELLSIVRDMIITIINSNIVSSISFIQPFPYPLDSLWIA